MDSGRRRVERRRFRVLSMSCRTGIELLERLERTTAQMWAAPSCDLLNLVAVASLVGDNGATLQEP